MALNEELLIETVRNYQILYEACHQFYHDHIQKENAWREISTILNCPANECKKEWTSLRDNFRKALRKRKTKSSQEVINHKPWKFENSMDFIVPFISEREQKSNLIDTEHDEAKNHDTDEGNYTDNTADVTISDTLTSCSTSRSGSATPTASTPSCRLKSRSEHLTPMARVMKSYFGNKQVTKANRSDHLTKLFDAMLETVRTFKPQLQIDIKAKISSMISEYELRNLEEEHPSIYKAHNQPQSGQHQQSQSSYEHSSSFQSTYETMLPEEDQPRYLNF